MMQTQYKKHIHSTSSIEKVIHLAGVTLWPWNFPEAFIQGQIVPNGVLCRVTKKTRISPEGHYLFYLSDYLSMYLTTAATVVN